MKLTAIAFAKLSRPLGTCETVNRIYIATYPSMRKHSHIVSPIALRDFSYISMLQEICSWIFVWSSFNCHHASGRSWSRSLVAQLGSLIGRLRSYTEPRQPSGAICILEHLQLNICNRCTIPSELPKHNSSASALPKHHHSQHLNQQRHIEPHVHHMSRPQRPPTQLSRRHKCIRRTTPSPPNSRPTRPRQAKLRSQPPGALDQRYLTKPPTPPASACILTTPWAMADA